MNKSKVSSLLEILSGDVRILICEDQAFCSCNLDSKAITLSRPSSSQDIEGRSEQEGKQRLMGVHGQKGLFARAKRSLVR